jgi:serine/threonine protein phosphatase PrpC
VHSSARFQDALAFTRSLGDLHLQSYGVTFLPEIFELSLDALLPPPIEKDSAAAASSDGASQQPVLTILACTDGIWDNWKYDDCMKYSMVPEHIAQAMKDEEQEPGARLVADHAVKMNGDLPGTQLAANRLISKNAEYAHANFGSTADNATAVVAFIWRT